MSIKQFQNYIDGKLQAASNQQYLPVFNPALGEIYAETPDSEAQDVAAAVEAAQKAFPLWSNLPAERRAAYLNKMANLIEQQAETLALAETEDNGKPLWLSTKVDIPRSAANFRFFGTALTHFASEAHYMETVGINYTLRRPIGIVGCISPWNLPLYLFTWKIAPALAAGNCVIAKPSEITPQTAYLLSQIAQQADLPAGVLNIIHGLGAKVGKAIVEHPHIKAISFTGGTRTGREIASIAAPMFKKLSLELGGKNPSIIFADCEWDETLATTVRSAFTNQGEICLCGSRILVEKSIYDRFVAEFVAKIQELKVGDPLDTSSYLGAVVSKEHAEKVMSYISLAQAEGGVLLTGGKRVFPEGRCSKGWFIEPTVIANLSNSCRTNQEEIFGPVVTIQSFETEAEAIAIANDTEYGLAANVWTQNLSRAHRVAEELAFGIVWVNCWMLRDLRTPFGGVKNSGVGREGGWEALRFFTEPKNILVKYH
ncbi:MAG: aldehyde dehydrogenase [Chitinophagales bacterium]|nr:aldehyde dehydrogenase [Chitinophagales bacterium]